MVAAAVDAIWAQVPAYGGSTDDQLRGDVAAHVGAIFEVFLDGLTDGQPARRAAFTATRAQASRRTSQAISLSDFLRAFRIGQLTLWQGVLEVAGDDEHAKDAALSLVERIMNVIELGSTVAAEAYLEAQQHQLAESDRAAPRPDRGPAGLPHDVRRAQALDPAGRRARAGRQAAGRLGRAGDRPGREPARAHRRRDRDRGGRAWRGPAGWRC
jgi:hypothetical protein